MVITYKPILVMLLVCIIMSTTAKGIERNSLTNSVNLTKTKPTNLNDKYKISTFISNGTKEKCVINVSETDLFVLEQLARSKVFHYVELSFHFPSNISNSVTKEWRWRMTNNVGKEILSLLALEYTCVSCTLDVGGKTKHVNVTDHPSGCTASQKDLGVLVAKTIMKQLSSEKEICFEEVSNMSTPQTRCCKSIGKDPVKYDCGASFGGSEFLNILESMLSVENIIVRLLWVPVVVYIGIFLQWKSTTDIKGYYKLTESRMSLSSILSMLFWDGYGKIKSCLRRCLLIGLLFILFCEMRLFDKLNRFDWYFGVWALLYPFSNLFSHSYVASECNFLSRCCQKVFSCLHYNIDDVLLLGRENVLGAVGLITLPFNIKRWKKMFLHFFPKKDGPKQMSKSDKLVVYSRNAPLFLVHLVLVFIMQIMFVLLFTLDCYGSILSKLLRSIINCRSEQRLSIRVFVMDLAEFYCLFFTVYFLLRALEYIPCIAISLLSGLLLNFAYFFPYIVLISVLVFYSWMYWTYVEEQYVVLMTLIFEENIKHATVTSKTITTTITTLSTEPTTHETITTSETSPVATPETTPATTLETMPATTTTTPSTTTPAITTPCNNGNNAENNNDDGCFKCGTCRNQNEVDIDDLTETVCVVSQELYDSIRKRLLPYHGNLFRFVLNILGISVFAVFSLTLVQVLQASDVSPTIQLFTTFSVGAFPFIMNTVAAKKGEKQKDAWEKQLKHCVEPLIKKIAGDKRDLRRTEFIITHQDQNVEKVRESDV